MKILGIIAILVIVFGAFALAYSQNEDSQANLLVGDTKFTAWFGRSPTIQENKLFLGFPGASQSHQDGFVTMILDIDDARTIRVEDFIMAFRTDDIDSDVNVFVNGVLCETVSQGVYVREHELDGCVEHLELGINEIGLREVDEQPFALGSVITIYVSGVKNPSSFEG